MKTAMKETKTFKSFTQMFVLFFIKERPRQDRKRFLHINSEITQKSDFVLFFSIIMEFYFETLKNRDFSQI
jgi:hypothetical protein